MSEPTVFVIDDDAAVRDALRQTICAMQLSVECYDSAEGFLASYDSQRPGCIVLDVKMPGMTGIELHQQLAADPSAPPVIIITGHGDIPMCVDALQQGAVDFLEKPYRPQRLGASIRRALERDQQQRRCAADQQALERQLAQISPKEQAVMEGIVSGKPNKQIAHELDISLRTLQFRRESVMRKLGVDSRAELIRWVARAELPK